MLMTGDKDLGWGGIALRFVAALLLVYLTFNPTGYSWFHWTIKPIIDAPSAALGTLNPLKVLGGIALAACWWFFVQTSQRSLGVMGAIFVLAGMATFFWALSFWHIFTPGSSSAIAHLTLITVAIILGLGMSWSSVKRRITGQQDTDVIA
jgi:hypothetical protein